MNSGDHQTAIPAADRCLVLLDAEMDHRRVDALRNQTEVFGQFRIHFLQGPRRLVAKTAGCRLNHWRLSYRWRLDVNGRWSKSIPWLFKAR